MTGYGLLSRRSGRLSRRRPADRDDHKTAASASGVVTGAWQTKRSHT